MFVNFYHRPCCGLPQRLIDHFLDSDAPCNVRVRAFIASFIFLGNSPRHEVNSLKAQLTLRVFVPDQQPLMHVRSKFLTYRLLKRLTEGGVSVAFIQMQMKLRLLHET